MGHVMTMTIDRNTWIAAAPRSDGQVMLHSLNLGPGTSFNLEEISRDESTPWTNYVRGTAQALKARGHGLTGFSGVIHSTIPFGSGLSSSAALEMAAATVFRELGRLDLDPVRMALIGQEAENKFVGVNSGILDQYSSSMGRAGSALLLDCRDLTSRTMPIPPSIGIVICDTRAKRELTGSEYSNRRAQCEQGVKLLQEVYPGITALRDLDLGQFEAQCHRLPEVVARRCRFVMEENQRVLDLAEVLPTGDEGRLRSLAAKSYTGARDLYEIGAPVMETMMAAMLGGPGVIAARQAGAGFGGCMVAMVRPGSLEQFRTHVEQDYQSHTDIRPEVYGVKSAPGAGRINF
jgi:galactokinase